MSNLGNINTGIPNTSCKEVVVYDSENYIGTIDYDNNGFGTFALPSGVMENFHSMEIQYGVNNLSFKKVIPAPIENYAQLNDDQSKWNLSGRFDANGKYINCTICGFSMAYQNNRLDRITTFYQTGYFPNGSLPEISECDLNNTCIIQKIILYVND